MSAKRPASGRYVVETEERDTGDLGDAGDLEAGEPETGEPGFEPGGPETGELDAASAGGAGLRLVSELTGKEAEGVTSVTPADDGWLVEVEIVEDRRIPSSGDMLAVYRVEMDKGGSLLSYRRIRRYRRSNADFGEA
ncbi:gas vesicle protein GvpO [Nonomuraea sp. NPDC049309]|uniref:gas vesicle protein GvpO n=1 Tax=Nonomuraea sp. NPDC049309 TaxID=3364350 RepID=UPI0037145276